MVRPWSVSFSGLLLWFLRLQLGLFDTNASQVWDLNTKTINSRLKLVGSPCALVYKKFRITCFPKVQHFVGQGLTFDSSKDLSFHPTEWQRFGTRWFTTAEDFVLMLWGWSIPLRLHIISTWKTHVLNIYCGHKFGGTVFTYFWVTGDVASPWVWLDHYDRSLSSNGTTELQKGIMASRRLFENWARRKLFPSAFSNVNEFNAKSPETGLVYLVWLQNPVLNWAVRPLLWWIRLSPPSLPLQGREVRHLVLRTSLQQGLCFSCCKLESWEFPDFGGRVRSKREVSGISKLFCFSP